MGSFAVWLARSPIASALKIFTAMIIGLAVADWSSSGQITFERGETWVIAGLASAIPVIVNWINPSDSRYGRVAPVEDVDDAGAGHYSGEER